MTASKCFMFMYFLLPHSASVMSSTRRTETPARYISMSASSTLLCRRKIAAVDPHIRCQQAAGVGDKGTVPSILLNATCFAVSNRICGAVIGALGATVFVTSVVTMRYSRVLDEHISDILY